MRTIDLGNGYEAYLTIDKDGSKTILIKDVLEDDPVVIKIFFKGEKFAFSKDNLLTRYKWLMPRI